MNILVISDLHIDTNDRFGTFQWSDSSLIEEIETLRDRYSVGKVIFNGDTFELLKYRFDEIESAHPVLMQYFSDRDFVFIRGNHDIVSSSGLQSYQITNSHGQTIHIEHGHNADWFNGSRPGRAISKFGFSLLKKLSHSRFLMDIYFHVVAFQENIHHIPKRYNTIKYLTYALKLLKEHDVVILAHTHKLESHHTYYLNKKKRYLNCGSCSLGRFQGIILDTETLKYELIKKSGNVSKGYQEEYDIRYAI
ncbi:MAG TPA: metallophosphoesterase [Bacteroidales bacterium]|nr:metallophosphoesterase [Bacteroidales bacterium]